MRAFVVLLVALAFSLPTTNSFAAPDRVTATFETLSASGVTGELNLNPMRQGGTLIHGSLRGLEPNTEYVSIIYQESSTCTAVGAEGIELVRFTANPAGIAQFNKKVEQELSAINSVSVQLVSDLSLQACADVNQ